MTIYDAGPLAASPLCGLLRKALEVALARVLAKKGVLAGVPAKVLVRLCH